LARQPSADQQQDLNQTADPPPARRGAKAATPKASEHADDVRHSSSSVPRLHTCPVPTEHVACGFFATPLLNFFCAPLQFDWEAGIAEDVAEADFGGDEAMEEEGVDEQAIEEEEGVDVGENTASAAVQQDDFAKRMAAFADAFD
jgi:hypothetical protein